MNVWDMGVRGSVPAASALLVNDLLNLLAVVVFSMMRVQDSAGDGEPLTCKRMV